MYPPKIYPHESCTTMMLGEEREIGGGRMRGGGGSERGEGK